MLKSKLFNCKSTDAIKEAISIKEATKPIFFTNVKVDIGGTSGANLLKTRLNKDIKGISNVDINKGKLDVSFKGSLEETIKLFNILNSISEQKEN